ncbi:AcrR family transcriptional regulator [Pseudonocardia eucalypti]|nr:AcrR family transcriptional regulator [Pseudonocardia eucalypti]
MNAGRTVRERARAELTREIADAARRQLADVGANGLSLRAVARELGMVSSALYRYFPSRDDLLTALIVEAYEAVADAAEAADRGGPPADRWRAVCAAIRGWALAHPHEYALIYGSPVPGYQAPRTTVPPAARIPLALVAIVRDAWTAGVLDAGDDPPPASPVLRAQLREVAEMAAPGLPDAVLARALIAWTQLFGMISFELFGQLIGSVDPSEEFFAHTTERMARFIGLPA